MEICQMEILRSIAPLFRSHEHNSHVLTCIGQAIVMMHDGHIRLHTRSIAYAQDNDLEGR